MKIGLFILVVFVSIMGCERQNSSHHIDKNQIMGNWINAIDKRDTLFIGDSIINRIEINSLKPIHYYKYSLNRDSITIQYVGIFAIYVPETSFKIELDNESIKIINISSYFQYYKGYTFIKQQ